MITVTQQNTAKLKAIQARNTSSTMFLQTELEHMHPDVESTPVLFLELYILGDLHV